MLKLGALIASVALVGAACGSNGTTDAVSTRQRSSTTTSTVVTTTTSTVPPSTTVAPTETTAAPAATTGAASDSTPTPALASPPSNGRLPEESLTTVTASCRMPSELASRLQSLLNAAHADGIALQPETQPFTTGAVPPRLTSCYRDFEMQQWWRDYYCGQGSCGMAAVPGTSVHGWGRAVDFEQGGQELAFEMSGYQWLVAHASAFGFSQPGWATPGGSGPEPWHWEAS